MSDTLLFADDSVTMRRVMELTFAEQGLNVVTVSDGQQAIDYIQTHRPSLALVSASLQRVNGFDVSRFVRDHAEHRLPVLLLAGAFDHLDEARVRESGAAGVIVKPFEPAVVIKLVKELLGMKSTAPETPGAASPSDSGRVVTGPEGPSTVPSASAQPQAPSPPDVKEVAWPPPRMTPAWPTSPPSGDRRAGDYFDQLDAAFESLDAQLAARTAPAPRPSSARQSTSSDDEKRAAASVPSAFADLNAAHVAGAATTSAGRATTPDHNPVFEIDQDWFTRTGRGSGPAGDVPLAPPAGASAPAAPDDDRSWAPKGEGATAADATCVEPPPAPVPSAPVEAAASIVETTPPAIPLEAQPSVSEASSKSARVEPAQGAPSSATFASPPASPAFAPADAFAMLWAQEQGEAIPIPPAPAPVDLSEQTVDALSSQLTDRVAARVAASLAERLADDLSDRLSTRLAEHVTSGVAEQVGSQLPERVATDLAAQVTPGVTDRLTTAVADSAPRLAADLSDRLVPALAERLTGDLAQRLSDGLAERVAELVAERALQSALGDSLRQTVNEVAERIVRAEIERIRAAAQTVRSQ
jgi:CheY-like chemotaxis protein